MYEINAFCVLSFSVNYKPFYSFPKFSIKSIKDKDYTFHLTVFIIT